MPTALYNQPNSDTESDSGSEGHPQSGGEEFAGFSRDDSPSVEEIQEEEIPLCFTEVGGRLFHNSPTSPYPLPVDTPEQDRQRAIHVLANELIGANYVGPVPDILAQTDRQKYALDLCTGTGTWVTEMAEVFPHVLFRGIDIVPIATRYPPNNVQFEVWNINDGLRWRAGQIDLVHARDISMAMSDYRTILPEIVRVLRPGGMFLSCEWEPAVFFRPEPGQPADLTPHASAQFFEALRSALGHRQIQTVTRDIPDYLRNTSAFDEIVSSVLYIPIGAWDVDPLMRELGKGLLAILERFTDSVKPFLSQVSHPLWNESLIHRFLNELRETVGLVGAYRVVYAIKRS